MGPLAGANGFARACSLFGESREIVLLQACSVPDRTQAVLADARSRTGISPEHAAVVRALEAALLEAIGHVASTQRPIDVIVLCNAAHAFLPEVLPQRTAGVPAGCRAGVSPAHGRNDLHLISLGECVIDALRHRRSNPALILSTAGTRLSRVFTRRLDEENIPYVEPSDAIQETLMRAIYQGVKALDWETASAAGEAVMTEILATNTDIGCIVAGCTEIPQILDLLQRTGSDVLRKRLSRLDVVDPVELALGAA